MKLTATHEFTGFGDYWSGNGQRWDDNAGCLFAFYDGRTTLRDLVDQWVSDYWQGGDFDGKPGWDEVTSEDVHAAIMDCLTPAGRADYDSGALAECAADYAASNPSVCSDCGAELGEYHCVDCDYDDGDVVDDDDCTDCDDCSESPIAVILLVAEACDECGAIADLDDDDLCAGCADEYLRSVAVSERAK